MRNILLIGAGRSSTSLINYFLDNAMVEDWTLTVADVSEELARKKIGNHSAGHAISFNIENENERKEQVSKAEIVISLLPADMHFPVAAECLKQGKDLVTASYVSPQMKQLHDEATKAGIIFLNECGLDPGLDHMSAMEIIDKVKERGGKFHAFRSYTGGLVAPESNDNPWGYKFSWNPRNVILAGQATARFIENGKYRHLPYGRLFNETETISIDGVGKFDGYANRDSLSYRNVYGLDGIPTLIRGTLRYSGFCKAWNVFVRLGITDDSFKIEESDTLTYKNFIESFLPDDRSSKNLKERLAKFAELAVESAEIKMIEWTGILGEARITIKNASPAEILQNLLEKKWVLKESDKDMIVMQHQFEYTVARKNFHHTSSLVVVGENSIDTAMAKTVGLPAAISAKLILNKSISLKGVQIPVHRSIYEPILKELKEYGISCVETLSES